VVLLQLFYRILARRLAGGFHNLRKPRDGNLSYSGDVPLCTSESFRANHWLEES